MDDSIEVHSNLNEKYRKAVRSKILKRIYDKNILDPFEDEKNSTNQKSESPSPSRIVIRDDSSINQKIRNRLSNEWQKTLERVLNYSEDYFGNKLEISRKDAIRFFINTVWQDDYEDSDDNREDSNETLKHRRKGKNKKQLDGKRTIKSSMYRAVKPVNDADQVLIVRRARIPWSNHDKQHKKININQILTFEFENAIINDDDEEIDKLGYFLGHQAVNRLIKEQIELNQFFRINILDCFQKRLVFYEPHESLFKVSVQNKHDDMTRKSRLSSLLARSLIFILNVSNKNDHMNLCLNNKSFILSIGSIKLDLWKHPNMNTVNKNVKKLLLAFSKYEKSISSHSNRMLDTIKQQIDTIVSKLENFMQNNNEQTADKETKMDLDFLQRLLEKQDKLIADRRRSLINLIQQWSLFQNNLERFNDSDELHEIDLRLDEIESIDSEMERKQLKELISKREKIQQLIVHMTKVDDNQLDTENIFLCDGRLPGEPKFRPIELILPKNFSTSSFSSSLLYCIEIMFDNKIVATFENLHLNHKTFQAIYDHNYRSFPVPICLDPSYTMSLIMTKGEEVFIANKLPKICIKEKNIADKTIKTITEISVKSLPPLRINSRQKSIRFEETFQCSYNETLSKKKSKNSLEGSIEFQMFWSSIPESNIDLDLFDMYDSEKRQIKQMTDLERIDQWLHDIRYQVDFVDSTNHDDQLDYHRQIELMQILLRQKYHIELSALYEGKKLKLNKLTTVDDGDHYHPSNEDGSFCTMEEIEQNKRFQMMIQRRQGQVEHRNQRFLPLTDTDVLFINDQSTNKLEKSSTNKLLEFVRLSSMQQIDRISENDPSEDSVVICHEWCAGIDDQSSFNSWYKTAACVLIQIWDHSIESNTEQQIGSEIVSLDEIIKEQTFDTMSGVDFSWLAWLFKSPAGHNRKLNPSRRNRHKEALNISEAIESEIQIHLLLQHATNVPSKITKQENSSENTDLLSECCSFVEIKIDNNQQTMSTSFSDGSKPNWNESFKFRTKLIPTNRINLNLFSVKKHLDDLDTSQFDMSDSDNSKLDRCWLGQLQLPLHVLMFVPKLEGSFQLFSPYFNPISSNNRESDNLLNLKKSRRRHLTDDDVDDDEDNDSGKFAKSVDQVLSSTKKNSKIISSIGSFQDISLSMFITIDPHVELNLSLKTNHQSIESTELLDHCEKWIQLLYQRFPRRRFICLVNNLQHRSVLAIRFLAPLKPPTFDELSPFQSIELKNVKKKTKLKKLSDKNSLYILMIIRYVSLIPSLLESNQHLKNSSTNRRFFDRWSKSNIWMDVYQFLTIRIGCQSEHAILLACFLQYMNKKAYLAIGTGLLDGPVAYVIIYPEFNNDNDTNINSMNEEYDTKNKWILIDAKRGRQFFSSDHDCTMQSIDSIITPENIYANIQKSTQPNSISYNLQRSNRWQPLLTSRNQSMIVQNLDISIQPQTINYGSIRNDLAKFIEVKVETHLREQFMAWRRHQTGSYTQFNRFCMQIVKPLLPELEKHTVLSVDGNRSYWNKLAELEERIQQNLKQIFDVHEMICYPLNVVGHSATDLDQLTRLIYATNLHLTHFGNPNQVEYVISCYVQPYPSDLYSLWIFLAALTTKSIVST